MSEWGLVTKKKTEKSCLFPNDAPHTGRGLSCKTRLGMNWRELPLLTSKVVRTLCYLWYKCVKWKRIKADRQPTVLIISLKLTKKMQDPEITGKNGAAHH